MEKKDSFEKMQALVSELSKVRPNQEKVKKMMEEQGLPYTTDLIEQMSSVLMAVSQSKKFITTEKEVKQKRQVVDL